MKIVVIGLGKLGYPMAEFLSSSGYSINCYDKNEKAILKSIQDKSYFKYENGLQKFASNGNKLVFHSNIQEALKESDICFITVPTPSKSDGSFNNDHICKVLDDLAVLLKLRKGSKNPYVININSTVSPRSFEDTLIPYLEKKGFKNEVDFSFLYNPYFVALGDVIKGLENPDVILIGQENKYSLDLLINIYKKIYNEENLLKILPVNLNEAELTKLLVNTYLTLKISFSNMVKDLVRDIKNVNTKKILDIVGSDTRIGKKYLKSGGPFSGPCLPRDNHALDFFSKSMNKKNYLTTASIKTNQFTLDMLKNDLLELKNLGHKNIIFAGIGYKSNTSSFEDTYILSLMKYATSINLDVFYFDKYIDLKIKEGIRIDEDKINDYSDLLFLSYEDRTFNKIVNNFKGYTYDIWYQVDGNMVFNKSSDFKKIRKTD